jgi:hypothetical protein
MNKFIKAISLLSFVLVFCVTFFAQNTNAQSSYLNTGVTINKATDLNPTTFAGARSVDPGVRSNTMPFPLTLNFSGGPVAGSDLNMDVYIVSKRSDGTMSKVATFNYNANACTRRCYDQTIPTPTSKWGSSAALSLVQTIKIPYDAAPGTYSIRVAFRRGNTYAKMLPGTGVVEYNDSILESSAIPSYEVGTFTVVAPCTGNIDGHYEFNTQARYVEDAYTGPEVAVMQNILKSLGLYEGVVNGQYGTFTANVMKRYQKSIGAAETGTAGYSELTALNQFCSDKITPTITKISPKKIVSGDTITIDGKNFISKSSNFRSISTQINEGIEIVSVTPTKITAKVYGSAFNQSTSFREGIRLSNAGKNSNVMPIDFRWISGVSGQPFIQKINGQLPSLTIDAGTYIGRPGSLMVIEGRDFDVANITKVIFSTVSGVKTGEAEITGIKSSEITVKVPDSLAGGTSYKITLANSDGESFGNSAKVYTATQPVVKDHYNQNVIQGQEFVVDIYYYNRNLELSLFDANEKNDALNIKPRTIVESNIGGPYIPYARFTFAIPSSVSPGKYNFIVKDGDTKDSQISQKYPITVLEKDSTPPTTPGKPIATKVGPVHVQLDWAASTDKNGVLKYVIYENGNKVEESTVNTIKLNRAMDSTAREFAVSALDSTGNMSAKSDPVLYQLPKPVIQSLSKQSVSFDEVFEVKGLNIGSTISYGNFADHKVTFVSRELSPKTTVYSMSKVAEYRDEKLLIRTPNLPAGEYLLSITLINGVSNTVNVKIVGKTTTTIPPTTVQPPAQRQSPAVTSIVPSILKSGEKMTINGKNFFTDGFSTSNQISEVILTNSSNVPVTRPVILSQSDTRIEIQLPSNLQPGTYSVVVLTTRSERTKALTIRIESAVPTPVVAPVVPVTPVAPAAPVAPVVVPAVVTQIPAPVINSILPISARVDDTVTLSGSNFTGVTPDLVWITNSTGAASVGTLYQSTANTIIFKTPNIPAGTYSVELTANGGSSNKVAFTVLPPLAQQPVTPYISSVSPVSAKANALVTVTGTNFQGVTSDLIFLESSVGSISPEIVSSSATSIVFKVPYVTAGAYKLYIFADGGASNEVNFTIESGMAIGQGFIQTATVFDWFISLFR